MSSEIKSPLFLGLDLSTQQLKAVIVQEDLKIVHESSVHFDRDLPHFGTTNGAILGPGEGEVTSPVQMWLEAMDLLMQRMTKAGVNFKSIAGISGSGQQHGSVYWSSTAEKELESLDATKPLSQLAPAAFSKNRAPIWQDSSTTEDCRAIENFVGGAQELANISGSRGYERFTGTQIRKLYRTDRKTYDATARISLVSSFIPSLFLGHIAPIEVSDASGMNLMDVISCKWDERLLAACGTDLRSKLGPEPVPGGTILGKIHSWWIQKWSFNPDCIIAPFTGDNPATVVALSFPGDAVLSLGTSTTFLLSIPPSSTPPKRFTTSHLLSHPTTAPDAQIAMLCYKNGALARQEIRDKFAKADWDRYNDIVQATTPGCDGLMGLYFPLPEIIPPGVHGDFFFRTSGAVPQKITLADVPTNLHPRLILESQFLSIQSRIAAILPSNSPPLQRLVVTGGSSANQTIRQLAADLFNMKVYVSATKEAAAMGGALLARYAWWRGQNDNGTFEEMCATLDPDALGMKCVAEPVKDIAARYPSLVPKYTACEEAMVHEWATTHV